MDFRLCFYIQYSLLSLFFFFLMIRRPPRSTLFPTRRSSDLRRQALDDAHDLVAHHTGGRHRLCRAESRRSEEHTSELQSHHDLVCRLLLEKKKTQNQKQYVNTDKKETTTRNLDIGSITQ